MPFAVLYPTNGDVVGRASVDEAWATIRAGAGTTIAGANTCSTSLSSSSTNNQWRWLYRGILVFDPTSPDIGSLPSGAVITGAWLNYHDYLKVMEQARGDYKVALVDVDPTDPESLAAADFGNFGNTLFSNEIAYASMDIDLYNRFTLNSSGIADLQLDIDAGDPISIGMRESYYDVGGNSPPWGAGQQDSTIAGYVSGGSVTSRYQADSTHYEARDMVLYGGYLYIGHWTSGGLSQVDPATMSLVKVLDTGLGYCTGLVQMGGYLYYSHGYDCKVSKINPDTMTIIDTWEGPVGDDDFTWRVGEDGTYLYVPTYETGPGAGHVTKVDPDTMETVGDSWEDSASEGAIGVACLGDYFYVGTVTGSPSRVMKVQKSNMTTVDTWTGGAGVTNTRDVITDETYIYVSHAITGSAGKVSKVDPSDMSLVDTFTGADATESNFKWLTYTGTYILVPCDLNPAKGIVVNPSNMSKVGAWSGTINVDKYAYRCINDGDDIHIALSVSAETPGQALTIDGTGLTANTLDPVPVLILEYEIESSAVSGGSSLSALMEGFI